MLSKIRDMMSGNRHAMPSFNKRPHNNRKLTPGRKAHRHKNGEHKGYRPNKLIRLEKWLKDEKRALRIFRDKPAGYQLNNAHKANHMEHRISELEEKIENFNE